MTVTFDLLRHRLERRVPRRIEAPDAREAAVAVVLTPGSGGLELLLIKRADQPGDPWSGQMALPGGRRDPGDSDLLATAARETREEVGVELNKDFLLGELDDLHPRIATLPRVVVRPFVFGLPGAAAVRPSPEVALYVWAPLERLIAGDLREEVEIPELGRRLPAYRVGDNYVWGMTERILTPFFELARP